MRLSPVSAGRGRRTAPRQPERIIRNLRNNLALSRALYVCLRQRAEHRLVFGTSGLSSRDECASPEDLGPRHLSLSAGEAARDWR